MFTWEKENEEGFLGLMCVSGVWILENKDKICVWNVQMEYGNMFQSQEFRIPISFSSHVLRNIYQMLIMFQCYIFKDNRLILGGGCLCV